MSKKNRDKDGNPPRKGWGWPENEQKMSLEDEFGLGKLETPPPGAIMLDRLPATGGSGYAKCADQHKPLVVTKAGGLIYGGSCTNPFVTDADVYIGFDNAMKMTARRFPWREGDEVIYPIQDMGPPKEVEDFTALIKWTLTQIESGRKVHAGCLGGHGRTGTFFAALVKVGMEIEDSITYVRDYYCMKAVESGAQVDWLNKHFGVKKIAGYKSSNDWPLTSNNHSSNGSSSHRGSGRTIPPPLKMFSIGNQTQVPKNNFTVKFTKNSDESMWD